ncbi:MAG: MBL fold metallo-hydrolase [Gammaproteobacteria bacterium]|jgi:glyoxylase-like metal-dependent hydrolase (beta-lactamase superfamily II)
MIFKQLFEPVSSTYTYLLSCPETGETALIDPVLSTFERDQRVLQEMGLKLTYTVETHIHADHITSARKLKNLLGSTIVYPEVSDLRCSDITVREGQPFRIGNIELHPLFTPGHTDHHHAYLIDDCTHKMVFTGDALLIDECGRTDFQSGDSAILYQSIQNKFFTLPDETLVYPCHDYEGRFVSSIAQEKARNPRLCNNKTQEEFVAMMDGQNSSKPAKIHFAVPSNMKCGACSDNVPDDMKPLCDDN